MSDNKNFYLLLAAVFCFFVLLDYAFIMADFFIEKYPVSAHVLQMEGIKNVFTANGWLFRAASIGFIFIVAYNTLISLKKRDHVSKLFITIIIGSIFILITGIFVFITDIIHALETMKYVYPSVFIACFTVTILLVREISAIVLKNSHDPSDLSSDRQRRDNVDGFYFKTTDGWINILNPFRGIFVNGGAGAGKTASIASPMIDQMVKNGWSGIVYDYKYFDLTNVVYSAYKRYPTAFKDVPLKIVNFSDLSRTNRINPIAPEYITDTMFIEEYANAILKNLNKDWIKKAGDFFVAQPILLLKAMIMFFAKKLPQICTIPHVFTAINQFSSEQIVSLLKNDVQSMSISSAIKEAVEKEAFEQVAGVISSLKGETQKLDNENFFWVLSGNEINLNLNDKNAPVLLCIVNDQQKEETIAPVASLIVTVCRKMMNVKRRHKSIFLLDEAPTMYLPKFETLPNTGRSNKICATFIAQDISQIDTMYGKDARKNILGSMSNMFFGNCNELDTLKYVSDFFGKEERIVENTSMGKSKSVGSNTSNANVSFNVQEKSILRIQDVASLSTGEYVGKIVDRKPNSYYRAQFIRLEDQGIITDEYEVPLFAHGVDARRNYDKIISEVMSLKDVFNLN
ncbi:MAG: type IV secretory system conjugative DNA transfer family protein [Bacteroidales bacterium]|jgi:hypothetical protein|nr:type IV secretory system conjugative DNA transfer family protein [Bacteroidales bacterium]